MKKLFAATDAQATHGVTILYKEVQVLVVSLIYVYFYFAFTHHCLMWKTFSIKSYCINSSHTIRSVLYALEGVYNVPFPPSIHYTFNLVTVPPHGHVFHAAANNPLHLLHRHVFYKRVRINAQTLQTKVFKHLKFISFLYLIEGDVNLLQIRQPSQGFQIEQIVVL